MRFILSQDYHDFNIEYIENDFTKECIENDCS